MRNLIPFLLFFFIFISCESPSAPQFADNYGETWQGYAGSQYEEVAEADYFVSPGDDIQSIVDKSPAGSKIFFNPGVYRSQSIEPKDGMTFFAAHPSGDTKAVLHGESQTKFAFHGTASNVTIENIIVEYYVPGKQMGAIKTGDHEPEENTTGWTLINVTARYNDGAGIRTGHDMRIIGGSASHNYQTGIVGSGDNILIEFVEIAYNNQDENYDYKIEAGGIKLVLTNNATIRNNFVHHNFGPGIWMDINNHNVLIEDNYVEDNAAAGIFHEISGSGIIQRNTVRRNGYDRLLEDGPYGAGIQVNHSNNVEVRENLLEDNKNGIMGIQQERLDHGGPHLLDNLHVHHNTIVQQYVGTWAAGVLDGDGNVEVFDRSITFEHNVYILSSAKKSFRWKGETLDWFEWQDAGHDVSGTLNE